MKKPNFFIVGAPKCGTSSLAHYLSKNPYVFMSAPKEPNYFANHLSTAYLLKRSNLYHTSLTHYLRLFEKANEKQIAVGEGSTRYLRSDMALCAIRNYNIESRIIVMLRNPVDLAYSWHGQKLYEGQETVKDFEKAWHLQFKREQGEYNPKYLLAKDALSYGKIASIGSQLEFLFSEFTKSQVKIIFFDDFIADTKSIYESVLRFLDVPKDDPLEFPVVNLGKNIRYPKFMRLLRHRSKWLDSIIKVVNQTSGLKFTGGRRLVYNFLLNNNSRPPLNSSFKEYLTDYFRKEIYKVEKITECNLEKWLQSKN